MQEFIGRGYNPREEGRTREGKEETVREGATCGLDFWSVSKKWNLVVIARFCAYRIRQKYFS